MNRLKFIVIIFVLFAASCQQSNFYFEEVANVDNQWIDNSPKTFKFPVKETGKNFTMYFIIRNNNDYKYSNIYFFTKLKSPDGQTIADTLEYQLAYPDGKWMGFGMGEIKQNTLVFKENIALQDTGIYEVSIAQAMREKDLQGIEDISLMIERN